MEKSVDKDFHTGHRERLRQKFIDGKISENELFELLLSFVIPRRDVRPLARGMMAKYGSLHHILISSVEELESNKGIGHNTAIFIKTIHETMVLGYRAQMRDQPIFHNPKILANYCNMLLGGKHVEECHILYLDENRQLLLDETHSVGTTDCAAVYPREILKRALNLNARAVVMLHNHPTPCISFSTPDVEITLQVQAILAPLNIELMDHYVVSGGIVYSARDLSLLK